jgi:hypothetical protein
MNEDQFGDSSVSPEWKVPGDEQLKTDAYHVWKPRPLLRSVHWKPVPAPSKGAAAGSYDVFIDQRVFKALHRQLWNAPEGEAPLGFLVGDLCEDPDTSRRYVIVSAAVPSKFQLNEQGPEQIPGEALVAMQLDVDRRRGVLAGWYHRHASGSVELTAEDIRTHEKHFHEPWQIALLFVTDHAQPAGGCFRRTHDGLAGDVPLPFFEMVSNESLLARGVRRSNMDWANLETADAIDSDPPARPEPAPEPEPEPESLPEPEALVPFESLEEPVSPADPEPADELSVEAGEDSEFDDLGVFDPSDLAGPVPDGALSEDLLPSDPEDEVRVLEVDDLSPDIEADEIEFSLPVLEEAIEPDDSVAPLDTEGEPLPEPGWDFEGRADELAPPRADDVDLDSFVTEVETADIAAQVDGSADLEGIEPHWDADEEDSEQAFDLPVAIPYHPGPEEEWEEELEEEPGTEVESEVVTPPEESTTPRSPSRVRRGPIVAAVVVLAAAVVASLLMFLGSSDASSEEGGAVEAVQAGAAAGGQSVEPVDGVPPATDGAASGTDPSASPAAADSLPSPVSLAEVERLGDDLLESVSRYYGRAVAVDGGQATCADLQAAYVAVEDRWIEYNVSGRARFRGRLPDQLAARDERLYAGVQDVEREFTRSGCERP